MSADLRPYPEYKDSGVEWLGEIPSHWEVRRIKTILREVDRRSTNGQGVLLSLTKTRGLIPQSEITDRGHTAETLVGYKICLPDEVVMNRMQAWNGMFAQATTTGLISPDYAIFTNVRSANTRYLVTVFRTPLLVSQFANESKGIGTGFNRLYSDRFGAIFIPYPAQDEQLLILRFLDHADRLIRRYIAAKRKQIALLNEQKQAIIQQAVTRGLDPSVRLKPSGVEWLGDVPEHWEFTKLKFAALHIVDCLHATPTYITDGGFPAIRTADVLPGFVLVDQAKRIDPEQYDLWTSRLVPQEGDILYTREGERFGLAALVPPNVQLCISQRMMLFRIRKCYHANYMMWQLNTRHVYSQATQDIYGATSPHINIERIRNYLLVVPPIAEQIQIADWIENQTSHINNGIIRLQQEIDLMREYRTRLIADVVTGKLDVREAAANLPDETGEAELLDESDALTDEEAVEEPDEELIDAD